MASAAAVMSEFGFAGRVGHAGERARRRSRGERTPLRDIILGVIAPVALAGGCAADAVLKARALAALDQPFALVRQAADGFERYVAGAVDDFAAQSAEHAETLGGEDVPFGYASRLALPNGEIVTCVGRFGAFRCTAGFELAPAEDGAAAI